MFEVSQSSLSVSKRGKITQYYTYTPRRRKKMGLMPLEFTECLTDSPYFREKLHSHEKELEHTSQAIKSLIKDVKDLLAAAKSLSRAQRNFAANMLNFKFDCIGTSQTDDEIIIAESLKEFGKLIVGIEDERDRMLERANDQFIIPLEKFRKEHIGGAKEGKKKYEKITTKFCQSLEKHVGLTTKKNDTILQEADAGLMMEQHNFQQESLRYVFLLQEVQECKKFEFVETLLGFMYGWLTFYHQGHEVAKDFKPYMTDLQLRLQKTRENFSSTHTETESLMLKMLEVRKTKPQDSGSLNKMYTREGYLFLMEKKAFGATWTKQYCQYQKENRRFLMIPYTQTNTGKIVGTDDIKVKSCIRRSTDSIERRFCFDIVAVDRPNTFTFQALSEDDQMLWLDALDGKEPNYFVPGGKCVKAEETSLNEAGTCFVKKLISVLEGRGLEEQGLYRVVGVSSKVNKLLQMGLDRRKLDRLNFDDPYEWENKTVTSALKTYYRNLPEPITTFRLHSDFIRAAKLENKSSRINSIHRLVHQLPKPNFQMLEILIRHLCNVAAQSTVNSMTVSNLAVCFGPTLLRPEEETVAAIMDIKFCNLVVEILIENCDRLLKFSPDQNHHNCINDASNAKSSSPAIAVPMTKPFQNVTAGNNAVYAEVTSNVNTVGIPSPTSYPRKSSPPARPLRQKANAHKPLVVYNPAVNIPGLDAAVSPSNHNSSNESLTSKSSRDCNHHSSSNSSPQTSNKPLSHQLSVRGAEQNLRVRTLYHCDGDNETELSFEPNEIITNVCQSREPGWLHGMLNGRRGLIPENYIEYLP